MFGFFFLKFYFVNVVIVYFFQDDLFVGNLKWGGFLSLRKFLVDSLFQQRKWNWLTFYVEKIAWAATEMMIPAFWLIVLQFFLGVNFLCAVRMGDFIAVLKSTSFKSIG